MMFPYRRIPIRRMGQPEPASTLSADEQFYQQIKRELLADFSGQFALIYQQELIGAYPSYEGAFNEAVAKGFPVGGFLIKEIMEEEPVETI